MFDEDLTLFFNTAEHAVSANWSGAADPIQVLFESAFTDPLGVSMTNPIATAIAAHMPNVARAQTLLINSVNYRIEDIEPDGTGLINLQLKKA